MAKKVSKRKKIVPATKLNSIGPDLIEQLERMKERLIKGYKRV